VGQSDLFAEIERLLSEEGRHMPAETEQKVVYNWTSVPEAKRPPIKQMIPLENCVIPSTGDFVEFAAYAGPVFRVKGRFFFVSEHGQEITLDMEYVDAPD
jgi:hypothetical protein